MRVLSARDAPNESFKRTSEDGTFRQGLYHLFFLPPKLLCHSSSSDENTTYNYLVIACLNKISIFNYLIIS